MDSFPIVRDEAASAASRVTSLSGIEPSGPASTASAVVAARGGHEGGSRAEEPPIPRGFIRRLASSILLRNAVALYAVHLAGLVLPLVTFPYLARVLRPEGWGLVLFAQSFGLWLALVIEYSFHLSGTRMIAAVRDDPAERGRIVARVLGARAILLAAVLLSGVAAFLSVPEFRRQPQLLVGAWAYAAALGLTPLWYFQGMERLGRAAAVEVALKAAATVGIFLVVKEPSQGWLVLILYAAAGLVWVLIGSIWIYREVPFVRPGIRDSLATLKDAAPLFAVRGVGGIYMQATPFVLGLMTSATVVAFFAGAERLIRSATALIHPLSQALYPRLSYLAGRDEKASGRLLGISFVLLPGLGAVTGVTAYVVAPYLVPFLLGPGYEAAVPVLRGLSVLPPIVAVATVLGTQWAIPRGHDRALLGFVALGALLSLAAAFLLVPRFGAMGMASSVVAAELSVAGGLGWLAFRKGLRWKPTGLGTMFDVHAKDGAQVAGPIGQGND